MPQQRATSVDNQFIGGLKTEFTGLNFPDNSCIDVLNCTFERTGLVTRRKGFDLEANFDTNSLPRTNEAMSQYWWRNTTGDGIVSMLVVQIGSDIHFYQASDATTADPLSTTKLDSIVDLDPFVPEGDFDFDITVECQYTDGNGKLFIFHPNIDPIYCVFQDDGTILATAIDIKIRDNVGIMEAGVEDNTRPASLTDIHRYNLANQGWYNSPWSTTSVSTVEFTGGTTPSFTVDAGLPIHSGDQVTMIHTIADADEDPSDANTDPTILTMTGSVASYTGTTLVVNIATLADSNYSDGSVPLAGQSFSDWDITPGLDYVSKWHTDVGNYPSNSDVWWYFKDEDDVFNPKKTINNITQSAGPSPKGYYVLDAFEQDRSPASNIIGLDVVSTHGIRPSTGTWFAGRIWYAGVNYKDFSERLYFSQIIEADNQFGRCYETNDLTSEDRFDLLPSDGGYVAIQGIGTVYKLFPSTNGLLVFSSRGIWFVTGSTGIGFTATDYVITKISEVQSISSSSFVNVTGMPVWWNEEGIYTANPNQGGFTVASASNTTIATYYLDIPLVSRIYARGYYNPTTFQIQWLFRDTAETDITSRYNFTHVLNFDTQINAFYPWSITPSTGTNICGVIVLGGSGSTSVLPYVFKYLTYMNNDLSFSEERDNSYVDWASLGTGINYPSYMLTGYRIYGKGNTQTQLPYVDIHTDSSTSYIDFQSRWDFTTSGDEGKWSTIQRIVFDSPNRAYQTRRRRTRGQGRAVQLRFSSVLAHPMSIVGWSTLIESTQVP